MMSEDSDMNGNVETLEDMTEHLHSRDEFTSFLVQLIKDYESKPDEWENASLAEFLHGMMGFCQRMEGYYSNMGINIDCEKPSWRLFADLLLAARVYE